MASPQEEKKDFLHVGIPSSGLFAFMGEGRVGNYALRNIDNDYRIGLVADKLGTNKLLAKTLLSQVEMGNVQLQLLDRQAREQGRTNDELRNLAHMTFSAHQATQEYMRQHDLRMDEYVEKTVQATYEGAERISGAIEAGFDAAIDAIYESGVMVTSAIEVSTEILKGELVSIGEYMKTSNETLAEMARYLKSPGDTKVKELLERSSQLIDAGMKSTGKWRYDNWRDALEALHEAAQTTIGKTNPMVLFQIGFLTWKCNERSKQASLRKEKLLEAQRAFDGAARLFLASSQKFHVKSMRHKAHMQYLLGDYRGALATLRPFLAKGVLHEDGGIECARYFELCDMRKEALVVLEHCLSRSSSTAITIFAEPDFRRMSQEMVELVASTREKIRNYSNGRMLALTTPLTEQPLGNLDGAKRYGTYKQHMDASNLVVTLLRSKNFVVVHKIARRLDILFDAMEQTNTSALDHARILLLYGNKRGAASLLDALIAQNVAIISDVIADKCFGPILELIAPVLTKHTKQANESATSEWQLLSKVVAVLKNAREKAGIKTTYSAAYDALSKEAAKVAQLNYTQALDFAKRAKQMRVDAFREMPCKVTELLPPLSPKQFPFEEVCVLPKNDVQKGIAQYFLTGIMLMEDQFPHSSDIKAQLLKALVEAVRDYNTTHRLGTHKLEKVSENGLGSYWKFCVRYNQGSGFDEHPFFAPHKPSTSFFGGKKCFAPGDPIELNVLLEQLVERTRDRELALILRGLLS